VRFALLYRRTATPRPQARHRRDDQWFSLLFERGVRLFASLERRGVDLVAADRVA